MIFSWRTPIGRILPAAVLTFWLSVCLVPGAFVSDDMLRLFPAFLDAGAHSLGEQRHVLGTDQLGRDVFAHLVWEGRQTLIASAMVWTLACLITGLILVPLELGSHHRNGWIRSGCTRGLQVACSVPFLVIYIVLFAVLPMWVAAAIAVASVSSENVDRIETRAPGRWLWVSAVARLKGTFFLVLTLEFLGLWAQGGWGDLIGQSRVYVWSHPLAVWPYIAAIASVGLSLHRLPYVRQDIGEQAV